MSFALILIIFVIWRLFDFFIAFIAPNYIPYLGYFSYVNDLVKSSLPKFIYSWANFDGMFMLRISQKGYQQYEQAFFPLYPLTIRIINQFLQFDRIIIGLLISNLVFLTSLFILSRYIKNKKNYMWTLVFLLTFPTSFYFGAIYTESLFFLLVLLTLYGLKKKNYFLVLISSYLAALTRLQGILLIVPILIHLIKANKIKKVKKLPNLNVLISIAPILGLVTYMVYLGYKFANPLMFLYSHTIFGQGRTSGIVLLPQVYFRYAKIILLASHDFAYFRALLEFIFFSVTIGILAYLLFVLYKKRQLLSEKSGLVLFSFTYLLMPTISGTLLSTPRMVLLCLPFFIYLVNIKSVKLKILLTLIFSIFHIILLGFFIQGYFIS